MFSKSKAPRFAEARADTPAPGEYDVREQGTEQGRVGFGIGRRFAEGKRAPKDAGQAVAAPEKPVVRAKSCKSLDRAALRDATNSRRGKAAARDGPDPSELQRQVKALEAQMRSLREELATATTTIGHQAQDAKRGEAELDKAKSRVQNVLKEKTSLATELASLRRQLQDAGRSQQVLTRIQADADTAKARAQSAADQAAVALAASHAAAHDKQLKLDSQDTRISELEAALQGESTTLEELRLSVQASQTLYRHTAAGLISERNAMAVTLAEVALSKRDLTSVAISLQHQVLQLGQNYARASFQFGLEMADLEDDARELRVEVGHKAELLSELSAQLSEHEAGFEAQMQQIASDQQTISALEETLAAQRMEEEEVRENAVELDLACRTLRTDAEAAAKEVTRLQAQNTALGEQLAGTRSELVAEQQRAAGLVAELEAATARSASSALLTASLEQEVAEERTKLGELRRELAAAISQAGCAQKRLTTLEAERSAAADENAAIAADRDRLQRELDAIRERFMPYELIIEDLEAQRRQLSGETQTAKQALDRMEAMNAKLAGHTNHKQKINYVEKLRRENRQLRDEISKLRSEATRLKARLKRTSGKPSQSSK